MAQPSSEREETGKSASQKNEIDTCIDSNGADVAAKVRIGTATVASISCLPPSLLHHGDTNCSGMFHSNCTQPISTHTHTKRTAKVQSCPNSCILKGKRVSMKDALAQSYKEVKEKSIHLESLSKGLF